MASDHTEDLLCFPPAPFLPQSLAVFLASAPASPLFIINVAVYYKNWNIIEILCIYNVCGVADISDYLLCQENATFQEFSLLLEIMLEYSWLYSHSLSHVFPIDTLFSSRKYTILFWRMTFIALYADH